jgi:hypothetical protein
MQVPFRMGHCHFTRFCRMLEVLMAARCADMAPAVGFQFSYEIARVRGHRASDYGPLK